MFSRTVVVLALLGAGVHFFRKDLTKLARVLQKPAENFVKEVKRELDAPSAQGAASKAADAVTGLVGGAAGAAEQARVAEAAARDVRQPQPQPPQPQPQQPPAAAPGGGDSQQLR